MRTYFIIFILIIISCTEVFRDSQIERGKELFEDVNLSGSKELACISCHPNNNTDRKNHMITILGRTWDSQTLWNVKNTGPYMWQGEFSDLRAVIKVVVEDVMLKPTPISNLDLDALTAYVKSIKSPISPFRDTHGKLNALQLKGKEVFEDPARGNCLKCHFGEFFTDAQNHKVARNNLDSLLINTPSLNGMWDTAPYWHNGQFKTIRALIDGHAWINGLNNKIKPPLTEDEKVSLEAYLNAL
jgi:cytochrome c peroxidase